MNIREIDRRHLWHPYTQHKTAMQPIPIVRGEGALLWDEEGNQYIDAIASWWVNPFGHSNKVIADAVYKQLTTLEHVLFGGFTHEPAARLATLLLEILPSNQQKFFFSDNGSTAVEVAIKASLQFFYNQGEKRVRLIAFEDAFHGDTFAAMAASGISLYTQAFKDMFIEVERISVPVPGNEQESERQLQQALAKGDVAAFIFEPLVLGAAGMVMYSAEILNRFIEICRQKNVLTIADEVMTGFGKTGKNFACNHLSVQPDIMCLSKALTAGAIPMAITTFADHIYDAFHSDDINKALFHGHTFTANPTGCAAAIASIGLLNTDQTQDNIARINARHQEFQKRMSVHPRVKTSRVLGVIFALEIQVEGKQDYYGPFRNQLYRFFIDNGVILRPVGNIVYILPPYIISDEQLQKVYDTVEQALEKIGIN
jgi:adenosylmethionine---8-amino-7-oxononanoate aminotransferase